MTNLEKAKEIYHKIGVEEGLLSALYEMAEWKDRELEHKVLKTLGCTVCKKSQCESCVYLDIKNKLL